ncbi:hypothetical protein ALQ88_200035 [Pseudomonas savastanoi]|nr:hypothetical protein ALQ88_200035 [Pseudomonas savastanoi]
MRGAVDRVALHCRRAPRFPTRALHAANVRQRRRQTPGDASADATGRPAPRWHAVRWHAAPVFWQPLRHAMKPPRHPAARPVAERFAGARGTARRGFARRPHARRSTAGGDAEQPDWRDAPGARHGYHRRCPPASAHELPEPTGPIAGSPAPDRYRPAPQRSAWPFRAAQ